MNNRPEELEEQTGNRFADGLLLPIFAVVAVFLFVILCFYAYNNVMTNKDNNEVVTLEGDDSNFKVTPENPGGMEVEHTDKAVFNTVTGQAENPDENISVQSEENPVSPEQLAQDAGGTTIVQVPSQEGDSATITIKSEQAESMDAESNDENTRTVTVAEDESPTIPDITNNSPNVEKLKALKAEVADAVAASSETVSSESIEAPAPEPVKLSTDNSKSSVSAQETKSVVIAKEPKKVVIKEAKKTESIVKAEVKKETNKATGESKTVVQFKDAPKSMKKVPSSMASASGSGSYFVQVSAHTSRAEAQSAWKNISSKYSAEIGGSKNNITEADVKGKKYYRLSFGPFSDRGSASTKCGILKAKGQDCIVQRY